MPVEKECGSRCRSRHHVGEITSLLTTPSCSLQQFQAYSSLCHAWPRVADQHGRTAMHLAASSGHTEILQWMLEEGCGDPGIKDSESGHTALHRALFYGHLGCARQLIQFNCDIHVRDVEGLSPLDVVMLDKPAHISYTDKEPNEVYTWGENYNSTLGHSSPHKRTSPEVVDYFKKAGVSIRQMVLCKYHCVFLSQSGQVYTCGHGQGGRLGHGDQHTVLIPRLLECLKEQTCLEIAAATDHTVLRMEGSIVYSFGINSYHQLGQTPFVEKSSVPKQMNLKPLKGKSICGVCVGRFHSVVWTPDSVFTVGLNAGQLGVPRGEKYLSQLRQVSSLRHTDIGIALVACSDAATVCLTTKGDIFVLHEYQCRKIASKWQEIEQVIVTGGNLDHNTGLDILTEKGGHDLNIAIRNESGQLFLWRSSSPSVKRCQFALKRQLAVRDIAMTTSCLAFSTNRGEAFVGYLSNKKFGSVSKDQESKHAKEVKDSGDGFNQPRLLDLLLREDVEEVQVRRLPGIHRATSVACDRKGRNFAVLQVLPSGCMSELPSVTSSDIQSHFGRLLQEAESGDSIHDIVVEAGGRSWPAHKYILAMRSDFFRNSVLALEASKDTIRTNTPSWDDDEKPVIKVPTITAEMMQQILAYIYTDTCDYLTIGFIVTKCSDNESQSPRQRQNSGQSGEDFDTRGLSAFQVQQKRQSGKGHSNRKHNKSVSDDPDNGKTSISQNPVNQLQDVARKLGVKGLSKRLEAVKCTNGVISSYGKHVASAKIKFEQSKLPELCDVVIKSEDGQEFSCHKCVLVARLEYFYSMLATGWLESGISGSGSSTVLNLPIPAPVLEVLLQFLYTDDAKELTDCTKEDFLCSLLIVSDQLLATRLKEMCEVALANILSFKNVGELLEFASIYQAHQLRASCQQFISINLASILEGRYLDMLSEETLGELSSYYRSSIPSMAFRHITPSWTGKQSTLDELMLEFDGLDTAEDTFSRKSGGSTKQQQHQKKRRRRPSEGSEKTDKTASSPAPPNTQMSNQAAPSSGQLPRNLSVSSDISVQSEGSGGLAEVIEEIERQKEEDQKFQARQAAQAKAREKMKWRPLDQPDYHRPAVPIQPEDIPDRKSNMKTLAWGGSAAPKSGSISPSASSTSLSSSAPAPSNLRDIMEQQESKDQGRRKTMSSSGQRVSWKDIKRQQSKEAKEKQQQQQKSTNVVTEVDKRSDGSSPKSTSNPWAPVGNMIKSFRELMVQEEVTRAAKSDSPPGVVAQNGLRLTPTGTHQGNPNRFRVSPWSSPPTSPPAGAAENPWQRRAAQETSTSTKQPSLQSPGSASRLSTGGQGARVALNFSAILRDEEEKSETLVKATQKPLALIQLEEQAMCELLAHYKAQRMPGADMYDRHITVSRVSKIMATPLWKRERNTSSSGTHI